MIKDISISTITMNSGLDIPGSTLRWALNHQFNEFEKVIVVDGNLTNEAVEYYKQFSNVQVIDSPWRDGKEDCYVHQYRQIANALKDGEWTLYLDDDEILSPQLLDGCKKANSKFNEKYLDIIKIPCVLHLTEDGKKYYPSEPQPNKRYNGQWTKNIIFQKNDGLWFHYFGSHVVPKNKNNREDYLHLPYFHMKTLESFVYNDVWQAFLNPQGQGYTPEEAVKFKMFTSCYKTTKEFKEATKKGTWPPPLKKFAWDHRLDYNRPISRLAWVYYILEGNLMPEKDESMDWSNVKNYVLSPDSFKIYEKHKKENNGLHLGE